MMTGRNPVNRMVPIQKCTFWLCSAGVGAVVAGGGGTNPGQTGHKYNDHNFTFHRGAAAHQPGSPNPQLNVLLWPIKV